MYISLARAEDGFRYLKSDLGLRPNFHQLEKRVDAHIFITILAYQLLCFIQRSLENAGDNRSWAMIKRIVQTHGYSKYHCVTHKEWNRLSDQKTGSC